MNDVIRDGSGEYAKKYWENGAYYLYEDETGRHTPDALWPPEREFTFLGKSSGRGAVTGSASDELQGGEVDE